MKWGRRFLFGPIFLAALVALILICLVLGLRDACYHFAQQFWGWDLDWRKVAIALAGVAVQAGLLALFLGVV